MGNPQIILSYFSRAIKWKSRCSGLPDIQISNNLDEELQLAIYLDKLKVTCCKHKGQSNFDSSWKDK